MFFCRIYLLELLSKCLRAILEKQILNPHVSQDSFFSHQLMHWFSLNKRDLPWRHSPSPYQVWVSEVMLQQTQVSVVIDYFQRWMERFPTLETLASVSLEEVIKQWEGLGYYSRARNLYYGAQYIQRHFQGKVPESEEDLKKIKGIGPYTMGAILSFAFHKKSVAVDGNVLRVLARYFAVKEDISQLKTRRLIEKLAWSLLPEEKSWIFNEALIEFGALICTKQAKCQLCPFQKTCKAYRFNLVEQLPHKAFKTKYEQIDRLVAVIICDQYILLKKQGKGVMQDLYEFPYFEGVAKECSSLNIKTYLETKLKMHLQEKRVLPCIKHGFTRFRATLFPYVYETSKKRDISAHLWVEKAQLENLPFSSGHKKIMTHCLSIP